MKEKVKWSKGVILGVILIFGTVIPMCMASSYIYFMSDDFAHALTLERIQKNVGGHLWASVLFSIDKWRTWQGTWFSMFLQALLSPLNGAGAVQLKLIAVLNVLLLVGALYFVAKTIAKTWSIGNGLKKQAILMLALFIIPFFNLEVYYEVFFWYSGITSYSMPLLFLLIGVGFQMSFYEQRKRSYFVVAALCLICMGGGTLGVAGAGCWITLGIALLASYHEKRLDKGLCLLFLCSFVGSLFNVLAPGNYIRQVSYGTDGLHFIKAAVDTGSCVLNRIERILLATPFGAAVILAFVNGMQEAVHIKLQKVEKYGLLFGCALLPIVGEYPMALAYGASWLENRGKFVVDFCVIMALLGIGFMAGTLVNEEERKQCAGGSKVIWIVMACMVIVVRGWGRYDWKAYNLWEKIRDGSIPDYSRACMQIYEDADGAGPEDTVVVTVPEPVEDYLTIFLPERDDHVNDWIAEYYGVKEVIAEPYTQGE